MRPTFRPVVPLASFVAIGGLVVLVLAGVWAGGEAVDHARRHAALAAVAGAVAAALGARWVARLPTFSSIARLALVGSMCVLAGAQLVEAVGALGYDESNTFAEEAWADEIHELGNLATTVSLVLVVIGAGLAAFYAATRMREWRRHPAAR